MSSTILLLTCDIVQLFTAGFLGLLVGALLAEGALLVPYWRTLNPKEFYALHPSYAPRLFRFFAPLTIAAPSLAISAVVLSIVTSDPGLWFSFIAAALSCLIVGIYFFYFKRANEAFGKAAIAENDLSRELGRWAAWHNARTAVGMFAFVFSLLAISRS